MSEAGSDFAARHGVRALSRLTVTNDEVASLITDRLAERIEGRSVVEIGAGIGLLSLHMARVARKVIYIKANTLWASAFVELLFKRKPANVSYIFGAASEFFGVIEAHVAVFATHSGVSAMTALAGRFAPAVIDIYGKMITENPQAFDPVAREAVGTPSNAEYAWRRKEAL
ncbi:hypothetical protein BH11PSE4_BH11PSE4_04230 [soil metagenome]